MAKLFGTDGVRGVANTELTAELAMKLGRAAAQTLKRAAVSNFLIARDTRRSGELLEAALAAGMMSSGSHVGYCGILPTPAVAFLVNEIGADAGAVISGSHNPFDDNGIKFFGPDGFKLSDEQEASIEVLVDAVIALPDGSGVGEADVVDGAHKKYVDHTLRALDGRRLDGMKVVVDCANGAASVTSPEALSLAGAEVIVINDQPNGININVECGSTYPDVVAKSVIEHRADVGLAHDGDGDRVIAVDETGAVVDGDHIIAALALELKEIGRLNRNVAVVTVMANLGLRHALASNGIEAVESAVGDRYVIEAMRKAGATIGGEQSGHVIFLDYATTGDGLVTGLRLLGRMASTGRRLSDLAAVVQKYPQTLINVPVRNREALRASEKVREAIESAEATLGDEGRVLVRPSGTEPLVRVMVEAQDEVRAEQIASEIAETISSELG